MSILAISLSPRPRLRSRHADGALPESAADDGDIDYGWSSDGYTLHRQGRCKAAQLPKADTVVAVVADTDVAWHRITLPKAPPSRLRSALAGVLEESLLNDAETTHLALAPGAVAGQPTWVAAVDRAWLQDALATLERQRVYVDRVVPNAWPDTLPRGHIHPSNRTDTPDLTLTWAHADGVAVLPLQGGLARALLPADLPGDARWTAAPDVAAAAERWLGAPVTVVSAGERALQATRTLWNLRQFDLAARHRGARAARDAWRRWRSPPWRPVRYGLAALLAVQVIGLNAWALHLRAEQSAQQQAMVALLQTTFPQVRAVLDAPLQMQREVDALRAAAGRPSDTDVEPMLQAAAAAWPEGLPPVDSMRYEPGRLTLSAQGWSDDNVAQFRQQLQPLGWHLEATEGQLLLTRTRVGGTP